ncbi:MAG TPA: NAD(P)/FAD-dependent oxidoreductase [Solirubrobacterales bacterium]|nr:NAD(P)/FAD-dependent oxidoreductase [Solirubrobacterales bacterium]
MREARTSDAVVVGSGPNGLAAAIVLARSGIRPVVFEGRAKLGGGMRTAELTRPGFLHDVCSAIHPLVLGSPFLRGVPLAEHGLELIQPPLPLAHPFDDGSAALLRRSVDATAQDLGVDARAYRRLISPMVASADHLMAGVLGPPRPPRHPLAIARFGRHALRSASGLARAVFETERARALFAGIAAHSMLPLEAPASASFGLVLAVLAHAVGWPLARGGSQRIADALAAHLNELGGEIVTSHPVSSIEELPRARAVLFDLTPRRLGAIAGTRLPASYRRRLSRYRYGPGVFKVDWALAEPIPWRAPEVSMAATVHLGGTLAEIAASERAVARGEAPERPYVLLAQQSRFDPTRAPEGKHTAWAYCHLPNGSELDATERVEAQVERFAPGFRDCVIERHVMGPSALEGYNPNYVGGDINGGIQDLAQLFTRPVVRPNPYATPAREIYICSSATPPGGGVHGMCGYFAARTALRRAFGAGK